jgi:hypothetical protein
MAPPVLAARSRGTGAHELLRYTGATVGLGGTVFGGTEENYIGGGVPSNRVIQAFGDVYQSAYDGLYVKDDPTALTGTFSLVGAYTDVTVTATELASKSGIHRVYINDVPHLCGWYQTTTLNNFRGWKYNLVTAVFTLGVAVAADFDASTTADEIVYRNQIFATGVTSASGGVVNVLIYNPGNDSFSEVPIPTTASKSPATGFLIHNDLLQIVYFDSPSIALILATFTGPSFVQAVVLAVDTDTPTAAESRLAGFSDGTLRYVFCYDIQANNGFRVFQVDNALTVTDLTTTVLPAELQSIAGRGGTFPATPLVNTYRIRILHDSNTNPAAPEWHIYLAQGNVAGTPWSVYKWNGNAAVIGNAGAPDDVGGDIAHALPFTTLDGGARIWTPGELDCDMLLRANALGGENLTCKGWGDVGPADKTLRVYANKKGTGDLFLCKLTGPVTGGTAVLNGTNDGIDNVEANPAVTYDFVVDFANTVPAIVAGERIQYYLDIS